MSAGVVHKVSRHQPATCHTTLPRHATTASHSSCPVVLVTPHTVTLRPCNPSNTPQRASPPTPGPPHPCPPPAQQRTAWPSWWSPSCLHGCGRRCRHKGEDGQCSWEAGARHRRTTVNAACMSTPLQVPSRSCCVGPIHKTTQAACTAPPISHPVPTASAPSAAASACPAPTCAGLPIDDQALALPLPHHRPEGLPSHQKHMGRQTVQCLTCTTCSNTAGSTIGLGWCTLCVDLAVASALQGCQLALWCFQWLLV
jgi:hypothetical protein